MKYDFRVASRGMTFIAHFVKVGQPIQKLKWDGWVGRDLRATERERAHANS
jgi:hypothetical protein